MSKCTITINGKPIETEAGKNVVDVYNENKLEIAHYCYHAGLSIAGQCRMCLVEVEGQPKMQIACNMKAQDGLKVCNDSPKVKDAVKTHLEMHLINHPIDCPICDQAGECGLQDYYMKHGKYSSEMHEEKHLKPKVVDLGERIVLDKERCILCSRCVRFTREVSKTSELVIMNRGHKSEITTYNDKPMTDNYQVNTVDICPVGALTSKDFRFEQRVWFLDETQSVCGGCSKGCNIFVHHKAGKHVYRLKPRYEAKVNEWWMCDKGRDTYKRSNFDMRLTRPKLGSVDLPLSEAISTWAQNLKALVATERTDEMAVWISPDLTNEEASSVIDSLKGHLQISKFYGPSVDKITQEDAPIDGFLLRKDFYPNTQGLKKVLQSKGVKLGSTQDLVDALKKQLLQQVVICLPESEAALPELTEIAYALSPDTFVVTLGSQKAATDVFAQALSLATLSHLEKQGTITNHAGIDQKLCGSFKMFKETGSIQEILDQLLHAEQEKAHGRSAL